MAVKSVSPSVDLVTQFSEIEGLVDLANRSFETTKQSIFILFTQFKGESTLEGKTADLIELRHQICVLQIAKETNAIIIENSKKQCCCIMEDQVDAIIRQARQIITTELKTQDSLRSQEQNEQFQAFSQESQRLLDMTSPEKAMDSEKTALKALWIHGLMYENLSPRLQNDVGIAKIALLSVLQTGERAVYEKLVALFPEAIQVKLADYLSDIQANSSECLFKLPLKDEEVSCCKHIAKALICKFPNDKDICCVVVQIFGELLEYASAELKNDPEIVEKAVQQNGKALVFASDTLKNTDAIVTAAVYQTYFALHCASARLRDDENFIIPIVAKNGWALVYASDRLKNLESVVLAAVSQYPQALYYASTRLKNDELIVSTAVAKDGCALQHASDRLKDLEGIVVPALHQTPMAIQYVSARLQIREDIARLVAGDERAREYLRERVSALLSENLK